MSVSADQRKKTVQNREELRQLVREVFGDLRKAQSWLDTPNPVLSGVKPKDVLESGSADDLALIYDELRRIDHGEF